jgi:outer membrane immunogenic protein
MKKLLLATVLGIALQATVANAADVVTEAMHDWTGLYVGVNGGYAFGGVDEVGVNPAPGNVGELNLEGLFGGIGIGYNHQVDQLVLGIEADFQLSDISDSDAGGGYTMSNEVNYFGTVRGRAGFAIDNALIYATGGLAYGDFDYSVNGPGVAINESYSDLGLTIGAGAEFAIDDMWSVKAEYLYTIFDKERLTDGRVSTASTPDFHLVRVGLNMRF